MNGIRPIRRLAAALAGLAGLATALAAFGATPAFATIPADEGGRAGPAVPVSPVPVQVHTIVTGGMPGWQITLIAIGAALLAATVAVVLDRARTTRRNAVTAAT